MSNKIITITREYGSGGRVIAQKVSEILGIAYYDNEIIDLAASELGIDIESIRKLAHEKTSSFAYSLTGNYQMSLNDQVYTAQSRIIKHLAEHDPCIIVNGCANYILDNCDNVLKIFIKAPLESRVLRVRDVYKEDHEDVEKFVKHRDKQRRSYYNYYTTNEWGDIKDYDLVFNSDIGLDEIAHAIANFYQKGKQWK